MMLKIHQPLRAATAAVIIAALGRIMRRKITFINDMAIFDNHRPALETVSFRLGERTSHTASTAKNAKNEIVWILISLLIIISSIGNSQA